MLPQLLFHYLNIINTHVIVALYDHRMGLQELKWVTNREENRENVNQRQRHSFVMVKLFLDIVDRK